MASNITPASAAAKNKAFSIANFTKIFNNSKARQYMSFMDLKQVSTAVEEKNVALLEKLYEILLQEQTSNEEIVREFVMTKNKILDGFMIKVVNAEKKIIEAPRKEAVAKAEKKEQKSAEEILKSL